MLNPSELKEYSVLKPLTPLTPRLKNHESFRENIKLSELRDLKVPEGPDLRVIKSKPRELHQGNQISPILSTKDKVHQKFKSEYNSFMNKIQNFESKESSMVKTENLTPKIQESVIVPEKSVEAKDLDTKFLSLLKKDIMVHDLFSGNTIPDLIPYTKFRKNPDNIIFVVDEDFFGYSKQELRNEVLVILNFKSSETFEKKEQSSKPLFFTLQIVEEEDYHIPTVQIEHILENSHPIYSIEKDKRSFHLYNLIPVEFGT